MLGATRLWTPSQAREFQRMMTARIGKHAVEADGVLPGEGVADRPKTEVGAVCAWWSPGETARAYAAICGRKTRVSAAANHWLAVVSMKSRHHREAP